jgi:hypothetical protein
MDTWSILRSFDIFYGHLVQFVEIWYIFPVFVFCIKKNLATLLLNAAIEQSPAMHFLRENPLQKMHFKVHFCFTYVRRRCICLSRVDL